MAILTIGDPAPWFVAPSTSSPNFHFDTVGGHRVVLSFLGSSRMDRNGQVLQQFLAAQDYLKQHNVPFFGVLCDPSDFAFQDEIIHPTYCKLVWDFDRAVSARYGVCHANAAAKPSADYTPTTFILNQNLQTVGILPVDDPVHHVEQVLTFATKTLQDFPPPALATRQAPVLLIPNVLERELCQRLIQLYEADGGQDSGFMRQIEGKTVEVYDYEFKQRRDFLIQDPPLLQHINDLILRRVKPEIEKAFQFSITRFERYLVACYDATDQGFFRRHRDNTTKGTAHRRFAMTLNLNTTEYGGGYLWFPECGSQVYRPEVGEAVIFSCSLLHEATPVTIGRRFALLSFFYNDQDAQLRERNTKYLVPSQNDETQAIGRYSPKPEKPQLGFEPKSGKRKKRS
ncbi:MAG: redoxin domain-containing protein [Leptolyngbyaceae cyanobacterium SM1_3_5]|nr:redoxin domain-containing protein [Leptolyngbyaceae cyanobacterium SM1_3_5]